MSFYICNVAVAPIRKEPEQSSEMVTSMVYGEKFEVLDVANTYYAKVINQYDRYEGYININQISQIVDSYYHKKAAAITESIGSVTTEGQVITLPIGCLLTEGEALHFTGAFIKFEDVKIDISKLELQAKAFLNTPYLWGGKTSFGIDCSGFMQTIFKMQNVFLPRDASQQANMGNTVDFLEGAQCGDLAFFDNEEGKIVHVGMLLSKNTIIHSAGKVKIDAIDSAGILNTNNERTHKLRIIKRVL